MLTRDTLALLRQEYSNIHLVVNYNHGCLSANTTIVPKSIAFCHGHFTRQSRRDDKVEDYDDDDEDDVTRKKTLDRFKFQLQIDFRHSSFVLDTHTYNAKKELIKNLHTQLSALLDFMSLFLKSANLSCKNYCG